MVAILPKKLGFLYLTFLSSLMHLPKLVHILFTHFYSYFLLLFLVRHVPPMVNQSPKPKPAGIVIGTKARAMQARPSQGSDTAYSSGKETDNELPVSTNFFAFCAI